jgi:hypothetical protein
MGVGSSSTITAARRGSWAGTNPAKLAMYCPE